MTTLGGLAAAARGGGVTLYTPSAATPTPRAVRGAPQGGAKSSAKRPAMKYDAIDQQFMASGEEIAKRQQQKAAHADKPWWQDSLGFVANVLSPLSVPQKIVNFGLEQAVRHLPTGAREFMQHPAESVIGANAISQGFDAAVPLFSPAFGQDVEKVDADKRSFLNKIAPRSDYGSGSIYKDVPVQGVTGFRNLALDIGHDPLTFVGGGERLVAKGAELGADATKAARMAETASRELDDASRNFAEALARGANPAEQASYSGLVDQAAARSNQAADLAREAAAKAANAPLTHAPSTVAQRASFISELAGKDPELVAKFQSEFTKGINRGFGRMNQAARDAIQMAPRGLRMFGSDAVIPGTGKLVEGAGIVGSGLKGGTARIAELLPDTLRNFRTPETLADARRMLRSKSTSPENFQLANDYVRIVNDIRIGSGEMGQRGATEVNRAWKKFFKGKTEAEKDALRVAAEASPEANEVNDLIMKLSDIHTKITGKPIEDFSSILPKQYLPHIQTKGWAKYVKEHADDPAVRALIEQTDFKTEDLLYTSGFVDKSRKLRLAPGEGARDIPLAQRNLRLRGNTIDDLNRGLAEAFPEFEGKFYETDLDKIFQVYNDALAKDAGSKRAWNALADSASPYGRRVEGELADSLEKMNEGLGQQSQGQRLRKMVEDRGGNFTPGERLALPAQPLVPGTKAHDAATRYWDNYADDLVEALQTGDMDRIYRATDAAKNHALPRTGVEILGKNGQEAAGFTWAKIGDKLTQVPDEALARGPAGDIPAEHLGILTPRVNDRATKELTDWAQSGVPTQFAGQANTEYNAVRKATVTSLQDMRKNAYEGLRDEVNSSSARIKSLRDATDEYISDLKGVGKVDRNNAAEVTALREKTAKNIADLENEIKQRNSVWKGKGTRESNEIDKELNRQLRVLKEHSAKLDAKLNELPADIRREIRWRREQLIEPVENARADLVQAEAHFKMQYPAPYSPERISWAQEVETAGRTRIGGGPAPTFQELRDAYREAVTKLEGLRSKLSARQLEGKSVKRVQAQIDKLTNSIDKNLAESARLAETGGRDLPVETLLSGPEADVARLKDLRDNLIPNATGDEVKALRAERDKLARRIRAGSMGHDEFAQAVKINADVAEWENRLNQHVAEYQAKLDRAIENMRKQPEALVYNRDKSARYFHDEIGRASSRFGTPPPEPGMTRLWRGDYAVPPTGPGMPDWMRQSGSEQLAARDETLGRWFHTDQDIANTYPRNRDPNELNKLRYVDVPTEFYERELKGLKNASPEARRLSKDAGEVVLPPDLMDQVQDYVASRPDVFQGRRVEPVTTPPQKGAYVVDVPGYTQPGLSAPDIQPTATTRVLPRGAEGAALRRRAGDATLAGVAVDTHAVQVPPQRLEQTALQDLERLAASPEQSQIGRYAANQREAARIAEDTLPTRIANQQAAAAQANEVGRLSEVLPKEAVKAGAQRNLDVLEQLEPLTNILGEEVDARQAARILRDKYKDLNFGSKRLDVDQAIKDFEDLSANNHLLDPQTQADTLDLLKQYASDAERTTNNRDVVAGLGKMARDARSGKLKDEWLTGLADGWEGPHKGAVQRGDVVMDQRLRSMLQRAERSIDDPKMFGRLFNEATNVFKTYATLSPSFHVRNAISGIFMNAADGVSLANQLEGWKAIREYRKGGEEWLARQSPEMQEALRIVGGSGGGGRFAESGFAGMHDNPRLNKVTRNRVTLKSQRAGEQVEQSLRLGMALDSVRNGQSTHQALERISKIHFDYSQLSKMDETMKRFIPFWTFMSRNLPMQMQMIYTNPRMYSAYQHFKDNIGQPDPENTPGYWKELGAFNIGAKIAGMPVFLQPDLGIDQAQQQLKELGGIARGDAGMALSELNPMALAPLQYAFKKDLYRDRTFTDADYSKASGPIGNLIKVLATVVPGATKEVNGERLVSDNFVNNLFKVIPPLSQASRLAPQSVGDVGDMNRQLESIARYIGVPMRTLSPKQQEIEARNRYYDALDKISTSKKLARRAAA